MLVGCCTQSAFKLVQLLQKLWLSTCDVWGVSRVAVTAVLVVGTEGRRLRAPSFGAPFSPPPPLILVWYSERAVCSLAISLLFIMAQTYEGRWIPYPACVPVCRRVCLFVCARVRSQHMLSSAYRRSEQSSRRRTCRLRSQHKLSEYLSGANAWFSILST